LINNKGVKKESFFMTFGKNLPDLLTFKDKQNFLEVIQIKNTDIFELKINNLKFIKKNVSVELLDYKMLAKKKKQYHCF
jgi:hypothetical protein